MSEEVETTIIKGIPRKILRFIHRIIKMIPGRNTQIAGKILDAAEEAGVFQQKDTPWKK